MDSYSRTVAVLKLIFPLSALVVLSGLFLLSESGEYRIERRESGQRALGPVLSTVTENGDRIVARAGHASWGGRDRSLDAKRVSARIEFAQGGMARVEAGRGIMAPEGNSVRFLDNVRFVHDDYEFRTKQMVVALDGQYAYAPEEVRARSPFGDFRAGSMRITAQNGNDAMRMLFTKGIKMLYRPMNMEEP